MKNATPKTENTLGNRCPACKASISYNPTKGKWKCDYCGSEFTLEEMQQHSDNASTQENNQKGTTKTDYVVYKCESCGAEIIADEQTSATFCVYCGNTAILKNKLSGEFQPDRIIPFKTTKEQAIDAFKSISKGRPLMPKKFNKTENIEKIRGIYIPFWLYDFEVTGDIEVNASIHESWTVGDTHYDKKSTYLVTRGGIMLYDNIPIDGSTRFDNAIMNTIEPFDYKELIPYNHAYLSGFYAEKYDVEGDSLLSESAERAINSSRKMLMNDINGRYDSKVMKHDGLQAKATERLYALLPVWMVNVKYKGKQHIFAMNGQTGEFIGDIPIDIPKTIIYYIVLFLIILAICILISYLGYQGGI